MKSSLSLIVPSILILCLIEGCSGPVEPTQAPVASSIPDSVLERLELQAMKIAHTYLVENTFTYEQDSLHVPQWALDTIGKALNAIWLSQSAERDTVMGIYKIEPNCSIDFKTIYVQGHIDTAKYSALLAKYSLKEMQSGAGFQFFQSTKYWNTSALCQKITEALDENDKVSMDPMGLNGVSGDFITPKFKFDGSVELEYQIGYGDCWQGCIHRRYWTFRVDTKSVVTFEGVRGDPPCDPKDRR